MTTYYNDYLTSHDIHNPNLLPHIVNTPIYNTPCRYYASQRGCYLGNDRCPFQHIDYSVSPHLNNNYYYNYESTTPSLSTSPVPNLCVLSSDSDDSDKKQEDDKKIADSVATKWDSSPKTILYGSRKNMAIQKFECHKFLLADGVAIDSVTKNAEFALMIKNCGEEKLNGLYLISGFRNGFVKYTECIRQRATLYCNPKRGWTISHNNAVYYYSFPMSEHPPTASDCTRNELKWCSQGIDFHLPQIKSSSVIGYDCLDLLFVGFVRSKS
eukprot:305517_1